ncbi:MAG: GNAT family N-acetyltransferase [Bacteroidetes bacterium]|nr:GNAT family N-acetyltransferase [Fibrella sp.]
MVEIRRIRADEYDFLWKMLHQAIYSPAQILPESIVYEPSLARYAASFGKNGDYGFVLSADSRLVGAAWTRLLTGSSRGYGFVDESTPELSMAIEPIFRGKGYGQELVSKLIKELQDHGYAQLSLSVHKQNRAINLYQRLGFKVVCEDKTTYTMLKKIE